MSPEESCSFGQWALRSDVQNEVGCEAVRQIDIEGSGIGWQQDSQWILGRCNCEADVELGGGRGAVGAEGPGGAG